MAQLLSEYGEIFSLPNYGTFILLELFSILQITNIQVKKILYEFMHPSEEGKLNILHTSYILIEYDFADSDLISAGCSAYLILLNKFFSAQDQKVI